MKRLLALLELSSLASQLAHPGAQRVPRRGGQRGHGVVGAVFGHTAVLSHAGHAAIFGVDHGRERLRSGQVGDLGHVVRQDLP